MLFNDHDQDLMNRALDGTISPAEWEALNTRLNASPDEAALWEGMRRADRLLRQAPVVSPPPDFTTRVMARLDAERVHPRPTVRGMSLALGLTVMAVMAAGLFLVVRLVLVQLFGPLPALDELVAQIGALLGALRDVVEWMIEWVARYPMLPAIGLASIPLAFAVAWLAVYYTPKDRLRRAVRLLAP